MNSRWAPTNAWREGATRVRPMPRRSTGRSLLPSSGRLSAAGLRPMRWHDARRQAIATLSTHPALLSHEFNTLSTVGIRSKNSIHAGVAFRSDADKGSFGQPHGRQGCNNLVICGNEAKPVFSATSSLRYQICRNSLIGHFSTERGKGTSTGR